MLADFEIIKKEIKTKSFLGKFNLLQGRYFIAIEEYDNAEEYLERARDMYKKYNDAYALGEVYFYLGKLEHYDKETQILNILADVYNIDFDSDQILIKRAANLAEKLIKKRINLNGIRTALGIHALKIKRDPALAINHFRKAYNSESNKLFSLTGIITAWVQNGEHDKVETLAEKALKINNPVITGLIRLSETINWLENFSVTGPLPWGTKDITNFQLGKYVGDVVDKVLGRLFLLEGNSKKASGIFTALVDKYPEDSNIKYYAAWAAILSNDREALKSVIKTSQNCQAAWAVAQIAVDYDPYNLGGCCKKKSLSHLSACC